MTPTPLIFSLIPIYSKLVNLVRKGPLIDLDIVTKSISRVTSAGPECCTLNNFNVLGDNNKSHHFLYRMPEAQNYPTHAKSIRRFSAKSEKEKKNHCVVSRAEIRNTLRRSLGINIPFGLQDWTRQ